MKLTLIGLLLIFIGIFLIFFDAITKKGETKYSFIGLIGPIPIVISNSNELLIISLIILIIIIIILLLYF